MSSEDVVRAYINRIKEVNPLINAVVQDRFEDALKDAKGITDYLRTTSLTEEELQKIKPLLGVPVTIKESCMLSGRYIRNFNEKCNCGYSIDVHSSSIRNSNIT